MTQLGQLEGAEVFSCAERDGVLRGIVALAGLDHGCLHLHGTETTQTRALDGKRPGATPP